MKANKDEKPAKAGTAWVAMWRSFTGGIPEGSGILFHRAYRTRAAAVKAVAAAVKEDFAVAVEFNGLAKPRKRTSNGSTWVEHDGEAIQYTVMELPLE